MADDQHSDTPNTTLPHRRSPVMMGIAILLAVAVIFAGGLYAAPYLGLMGDGDTPPAATQQTAETPATAPAAPKYGPGDCREFEKTVEIAGETRTVSGRACMQQDGSWQVAD